MHNRLIALCSFLLLAVSLSNPGLLVSIPFPLSIPTLDLHLPVFIQPIAINQLELTSIYIRQVEYNWTFSQKTVDVKVSNAKISFDWNYKSDSGIGAFTQSLYQILLNYDFKQTNQGRLDIKINSTSSKLGHSEVHIGGTTKQSVIIEITNLVMNHAAIIFRKQIENAIKNAVQSFSSILGNDIKLFCIASNYQLKQNFENRKESKERCIFMNTTLVASPIINNKTLLIQLNGAPYVQNQKSGQLNPSSAMIKQNSTKIQIQIHKKFLETFIQKTLSILKNSITLKSMDITSVVDVDSQALSPFFPAMRMFNEPKNVLFQLILKQNNLNLTLNSKNQLIHIDAQLLANIATQNLNQFDSQKYGNQANISGSLDIKVAYGQTSFNAFIEQIKLKQLQCNSQDINQGLINPSALLDIKQSLFDWLKSGANGSLNSKLIRLEFSNICAGVLGKIYDDRIRLQLALQKINNKLNKLSFTDDIVQE